MNIRRLLILVLFALILIVSGCQNMKYNEYDKRGNLLKEYSKKGFPDFSDNKSFSFEAHCF